MITLLSCNSTKTMSEKKIINSKTGGINITQELYVTTDLKKKEIIKKLKNIEYKNEINAEGFSSLIFDSIKNGNIEFEITLKFHNDNYCGFDLFFKDNEKASKHINENWTDSYEGAQYELYKEWLEQEIGENQNFEWGKIKAFRNGMLGIGYVSCKVKEFYPRVYYLSGW